MTVLFRPERRSDQSAPHDGRPRASVLLASPRFMALAALMTLGLVGMYLSVFLVRGLEVPVAGGGVGIILVLTGLGMLVVGATSRPVGHVRLVDVLAATAGAALAQFLTREMAMPLLVAGSLVAVIVGIAEIVDGPLDGAAARSAYAGVCVGLIPPYITQSSWLVIAAAVVCGVLWSLIGPSVWDGIGGRIGAVAFIAGSLVYLTADAFGLERNHHLLPLRIDGFAHFAVLPVAATAAVLTWIAVERLGVPFVLASGGLSLVVCVTLYLTQPVPASVLDVAFFGGTFVGGSSARRLPNAAWVAAAGLVFGILMLHFQGPLTGHVGIVGAIGTIACLAIAGLEWLVLAPRVNAAAGRLLRRSRVGAA